MAQFDVTDDRVRPVVFAALQQDLLLTEARTLSRKWPTYAERLQLEHAADAVCKALEDLQDEIDREFDMVAYRNLNTG